MGNSEKNAYQYCIKELKNVFPQNAPSNMLRKFNARFKKDETGKLREWPKIEENKIKELFEEAKQAMETTMEQFKRIYFPTGVTKMEELVRGKDDFDLNKTPTMEDLLRQEDFQQEPDAAMKFRRTTTSISI